MLIPSQLLVWMELVYPPVKCDAYSFAPLSFYYYPILMTIVDFCKLNVFIGVEYKQWYSVKNIIPALSSFGNLMIFVFCMMVTFIQATYYPFHLIGSIMTVIWNKTIRQLWIYLVNADDHLLARESKLEMRD